MAREINWDEPLSDEDRAWVEQRPDMPAGNGMTVAQRLAQLDSEHGIQNGKTREQRMEELRTTIADATNELERLEREVAAEANPNVSQTGDAASGVVRDNTPVDGNSPEGAPEAGEDYSDTKRWTVAALKAEIEDRNEDRLKEDLEPMSTSGNRSELVERLIRDDRELAEAEAQG